MGRKLKDYHIAAIEFADRLVPDAKRLLEQRVDSPSIQRRWIRAHREEVKRLCNRSAKESP